MFYTKEHEWIDFQGTVAYIGVNKIKFLTFSEIEGVNFNEFFSYKKQNEEIAWIQFRDDQIAVHMPVDGSIIQVNKIFLSKDLTQISDHLHTSGWIFSIIPSQPYSRRGLIEARQYLDFWKKSQTKSSN